MDATKAHSYDTKYLRSFKTYKSSENNLLEIKMKRISSI